MSKHTHIYGSVYSRQSS